MTTTTNVEWMIYSDDGSWLGDYSSKSAAIEIAQNLTGVQVKKLTTSYVYNADTDEYELINDAIATIYIH